ncbi:CHAD domain-containing protein [Austwickia chelonae]|uniref:CHAD domain-containing protein n=1 Tax=Austwickia chelonae NBRC 105200 TaxID=1184607 RepID=K6VTC7_9MICO|nr:CYTH and CHAD domain-containing protein [Austwickia chelonae]GAB78575.1 hypothetical protein AUCHE_12_00210 [Austwickia chelonae NBRC 105200]SEW40952.1 CHAD domain-containing protein [Austwickia chelonae]
MATAQDETERTFDVPDGWTLPRLTGTGTVHRTTRPRRFTQTATYLDTPDLTLLRARHTLRRRTGGLDAGWHLKLPPAGDTRREIHEPLGHGPARIPTTLVNHTAHLTEGAPLIPVTILTTRRTRRELLDNQGELIAEIVDDTVENTLLIDHGTSHWREIELELGPAGTPQDFDLITEALLNSGLTLADMPSKLGRALAEPLARRTTRPTGNPTRPVDRISRYLADQLGVIQHLEEAVRADDPHAIHRTRVATRRARSTLTTFHPLYQHTDTQTLINELTWLAKLLGGPRDCEVLAHRLTAALDDTDPRLVTAPARRRLLNTVHTRHRDTHHALVTGLDTTRYARLLEKLTDAVRTPPTPPDTPHTQPTPTADELTALAGHTTHKVTAAAERAARATTTERRDHHLHTVRKRAKAARYAAEALGSDKDTLTPWTTLQEALGNHQDGVLATEIIHRAHRAARAAGEDTLTYGALLERESAAARTLHTDYRQLLADALTDPTTPPTP